MLGIDERMEKMFQWSILLACLFTLRTFAPCRALGSCLLCLMGNTPLGTMHIHRLHIIVHTEIWLRFSVFSMKKLLLFPDINLLLNDKFLILQTAMVIWLTVQCGWVCRSSLLQQYSRMKTTAADAESHEMQEKYQTHGYMYQWHCRLCVCQSGRMGH